MDYMITLTYVSFSYLSKDNSGGKVVHWTLTLSQDSCSLYEPMHPPTFPPYFCLAHIFKKAWVNRNGVTKKMQIIGEPMPIFFVMLDLVFLSTFLTWGSAGPKYMYCLPIKLLLPLQPLHSWREYDRTIWIPQVLRCKGI